MLPISSSRRKGAIERCALLAEFPLSDLVFSNMYCTVDSKAEPLDDPKIIAGGEGLGIC